MLTVAILMVMAGVRRVTTWTLAPAGAVVVRPFGSGRNAVGRAIGLDGRLYGPLAFAVGSHRMAIADTYQARILYRGTREHTIAASKMMVEDVALTPSGAVLAADNRALAVWRVGEGSPREVVAIGHQPGFTESIWRVEVGHSGQIYVEWVRFGHGTFAVGLSQYSRAGRFLRQLSWSEGGQPAGLKPIASSPVKQAIRTFQLAPNGDVYVETPGGTPMQRRIRIYQPDGRWLRNVTITSPVPILHSDLLGVSRQGWIYLGINLTIPQKARIVVATGQGRALANFPVGAVPVYAAVYGRVGPNGSLYLDQSTATRYRIVRWRPVGRQTWRWS